MLVMVEHRQRDLGGMTTQQHRLGGGEGIAMQL